MGATVKHAAPFKLWCHIAVLRMKNIEIDIFVSVEQRDQTPACRALTLCVHSYPFRWCVWNNNKSCNSQPTRHTRKNSDILLGFASVCCYSTRTKYSTRISHSKRKIILQIESINWRAKRTEIYYKKNNNNKRIVGAQIWSDFNVCVFSFGFEFSISMESIIIY